MRIHDEIVKALRKSCQANSDAKKATKMRGYMKDVLQFYGIAAPGVKEIYSEQHESIMTLNIDERFNLATELLSSKYSEEKHLGVQILSKSHTLMDAKYVTRLAPIIEKHVYDWGTCDSLSSRVIRHLIIKDEAVINIIVPWKDSKCMWLQRVSCVSFVFIAKFGQYNETIIDICQTCVTNSERFVQLGTGWVLRELGLADIELVVAFIFKNYDSFSREGLRYAIEKMDSSLRKQLLDLNTMDEKKRNEWFQQRKSTLNEKKNKKNIKHVVKEKQQNGKRSLSTTGKPLRRSKRNLSS